MAVITVRVFISALTTRPAWTAQVRTTTVQGIMKEPHKAMISHISGRSKSHILGTSWTSDRVILRI